MTLDSTVIGPFVHTLFLGASITKFSASVGWNTNPSEITVELVEDPNPGSKLYYNGYGNSSIHSGPDRFNPPPLGSPVFFKFGAFQFMGLLQNWQEREGIGGKLYTVKIVSPHDILEGTYVILDSYSGPVYDIPNIINVFGYLESSGTSLSPTKSLTIDAETQAIVGYEYATGFGGAKKNTAGIPWLNIRDALCSIINNMSFGDIQKQLWNVNNNENTKYGKSLALRDHTYIFDVTSLPLLDNTFRFNDESISLLDLTAKVCEYCGEDFYIELVLVSNSTMNPNYIGSSVNDNNPYSEGSVEWANYFSGHIPTTNGVLKFIKIYRSSRLAQPEPARLLDSTLGSPITLRLDNFGAITSAINKYAIPMSNRNRGLEFRNETTNCFLVGEYRHDLWQIYCGNTGSIGFSSGSYSFFDGGDVLNGLRSFPFGDFYTDGIFPYWGKDDDGVPIYSSGLAQDHVVKLNLRNKFDAALEHQISGYCPGYIYYLSAGEISAIQTGDKEVWGLWIESNSNPYLDQKALYKGGPNQAVTFNTAGIANSNSYGTGQGEGKRVWLKNGRGKPYYVHVSNRQAAFNAGLIAAGDGDDDSTMSDKLFEYFKGLVDTYFGKKYVVQLPSDTCGIILKDEPFSIKTNYEVADSAWNNATTILGLDANCLAMSIFKNIDDGKVQCFAHASAPTYIDGAGATQQGALDITMLNKEDYYLRGNGDGFVKAKFEEIVFLNPTGLTYPRAVISLSQPLYPFNIFVETVGGVSSYIKRDWRSAANNMQGTIIRVGPGIDTADTYPFIPLPITPNSIALPLKNTMACYGPWYLNARVNGLKGAIGKTEFIRDTNLAPWNFGSNENMNLAGQMQVSSRIMQHQLSEVGGFTMPGAPLVSLGRVLISNGPEVTNIDVSVGTDGVQTTYQMRTFTPNYGSFAKSKVDNLARVGRNSSKAVRMLQQTRYGEIVERKNVSSAGNSIWSKSDRFNRASSSNIIIASAEKTFVPSGESYDIDGVYIDGELCTWDTENLVLKETSGITNVVVNTDLRKGIPELCGHDNNEYLKRAGIEQIGLFRPYTTLSGSISNMAEMPISTVVEGSISGWCPDGTYTDTTNNNISKFGIPPLYSGYFPPICATTLNPFLVPVSGKTRGGWQLTSGVDANGHDIDYVVRDSGFPSDLAILPTNDYSQYDWYRAIGLKAPLVLVGWGYDIDGRPVPNAKVDASGRGMTQYFEDDWLRKPQNWKAGPVDLRWDQDRGVWAPPQLQTMARIKCTQDWNSNRTVFKADLLNIPSGSIYNKDGEKFIHPWIEVYNPWRQAICSGMYGWAYYNPNLTYTDDGYTKLAKHQKYELMSIESPIATLYTTGGGSGTIYSLTMTPPNTSISLNRWNPVKILNAPDISGYYITAQLTSILGQIESAPDSTSGHIGNLIFTPTDFPTPIEAARMIGPLQARFDRTGDIRTVRNSLNVASGFNVNLQWNGNEWLTVNTEGYNTPVLGIL